MKQFWQNTPLLLKVILIVTWILVVITSLVYISNSYIYKQIQENEQEKKKNRIIMLKKF